MPASSVSNKPQSATNLSQQQTSVSNKPQSKPMNQEPSDQHQPVATATPEMEEPVYLQHAAAVCGVKEVTIRKWCRKKLIQWQHIKEGARVRCRVRISDVRAYNDKRNPSAVGRVETAPAMPHQAQPSMAHQIPAVVPQMPVGGPAPDAPPQAPAPVTACTAQAESHQSTTETNSAAPSLNVITAVPQPTVTAQSAPSHPPTSLKQKTKPQRVKPSVLLMNRAKNSMRKFGANELQKLAAWINQRLANKFAPNTNPAPSEQPTPAS